MVVMRRFRLNGMSGGLVLSLMAHGLLVAALLFGLPEPVLEPEPEEQAVAVTIVPPPEREPEPEPEPEAESEQAEDPEPDVEAAEAELPPEAASEELPPAGSEAAADEGAPIPVLQPVFQFGEQDAGPELALDGGAAEAPQENVPEDPVEEPAAEPPAAAEPEEPDTSDESEAPEQPEAPDEPEAADQLVVQPAVEDVEEQPVTQDEVPALAMPADIALPDAELDGDVPGALADAASQTELASLPEGLAVAAVPVPQPRPANPAKPDTPAVTDFEPPADTAPARDNGLPGVRQLSSSVNTGHAVATTAMRNMPRNVRGSRLCTTELREQLRRAPEPYRPELLPSYGLPGGNVLAVPKAAFRSGGAWYDLSFRCTVDDEALKVTGFAFKVGNPIPRQEWKARGFPEF